MLLALLLTLVPAVPQADGPDPITVKLNHEQFSRGDKARVYVQTAQDGHLVVLHADAAGRIRVLFPVDPSADDFVRGGRQVEVRGRGDRDAFLIDTDDGSGTVLAAVSPDPFTYASFVRNDHWDFRALGGPSASVQDDPMARLLDLVQRMTEDSVRDFGYDATTYVVTSNRVASDYGYDYPYHFGVGLSFGYPYRYGYSPFYDPFCADPFYGWGTSCYGFGFGYSYYRPYYYPRFRRPWVGATFGGGIARGGEHFVIPAGRSRYISTPVRQRSGSSDAFGTRSRGVDSRPRGFDSRPRSIDRPAVAPRSRPSGNPSRGQPRGWSGRGSSGGSRPAGRVSGGNRGGGSSRGGASRGGGGGGRRH